MNTLYVRFRPEQLRLTLLDQNAHLVAQMDEPVGERSLLSAVFLLDRHFPVSQLVWEYSECDSITTHCYAMVMLERIFGVALHIAEPEDRNHTEKMK